MASNADVLKSAAEMGINAVTINAGASVDSTQLDRGENLIVDAVTVLLKVTGLAAACLDGGYFKVSMIPLDGTGGTEYNDGPGGIVLPITDALYDMPATLALPPGVRFFKIRVTNVTSQNTDANAVSAKGRWSAVTL